MKSAGENGWNRLRKVNLKTAITLLLIAMMYIVVVLSVIDLGYNLFSFVIAPPLFIVTPNELQELLGLFLLVLVAIELLDTVRAYLVENVVHAEVVLEAAMIAVARKIIVLDSKATDAVTILAIAAVVLALATAYFVVKRTHSASPHGRPMHLPDQSGQS